MCVTAGIRIMGCGRSRHNSPEDSQTDLKNSDSFRKNNSKKNINKNAKKKRNNHEDKNCAESDTNEKSSSFKKLSNGKSKSKDRHEDTNSSTSFTSGSQTGATSSSLADGDKSNGATKPQGGYYLLEVPHEVYKAETSSRLTSKDFKTVTSTRTVHVTSSQLEFFKMLDEKIEMGGDYQTSNDASEVSSMDETWKQ